MEDHQVVAMMAITLLASSHSGGGFSSERAHQEVVSIAHAMLKMAKKKVAQEED